MKISEYNEMMAYLLRPRQKFANGGLSKKEKIAQGLEKGRVSKLIDVYTDALNDFDKMVREAFDQKDASKFPENLKKFLEKRGLKDTTYYNLESKLPFSPNRNVAALRAELASILVNEANRQPKFITLNDLLKKANFTDKQYKVLSNDKRVLKLDTAADKAAKAYNSIFRAVGADDKNIKEFFNPREQISKITGLSGETISKKFDVENYAGPEAAKLYSKLSNNKIQKIINNSKQDFTLESFTKKMDSLGSQARAQATRKSRLEVAAKKAGEGVADINEGQKEVVKLLNDHYKKYPEELLGNTKLRNLLDLTLKDGEIVKKNKYVTDEDFKKLIKEKNLFTIDHVDEVQFEKLSTEFPVFKQLATYNTNSGLIKSIKSYVAKNQNSTDPVVQNKIKKQIEFLEDLKLKVDTPTGRIGSKEVLAAVDRKAGVLPNFLAQLKALNIKLPGKAKVALLGIGGGLGVQTLASAGPIEDFTGRQQLRSARKSFKRTDEEGFSDTEKLLAGTTAGSALFAARKPILKTLGKVARPFGFPSVAAGFAAGELLSDDPNLGIAGAELLAPELIKTVAPRGAGIMSQIGRFAANPFFKGARLFTPIGLGLMGIEGIRMGMEEQERMDRMKIEDPEQYEEIKDFERSLLEESA